MIPTGKLPSISTITVWALLQLVLLGCGASGFSLWSHHPYPRESLALQELFCGQLILISLLFPWLSANRTTVLICISLMFPLDELAGLLSNAPQAGILRGFFAITIWWIGLYGCLNRIRGGSMILTSVAMLFTVGGAVLDYLRWEAIAGNGQSDSFRPLSLLPQVCELIQKNGKLGWLEAASSTFIAVLLILSHTVANRHSNKLIYISTSSHSR